MAQSILLVAVTALLTWFIARWSRSAPVRPKSLSPQEREAEHAKEVGTRLDGARDRASVIETERNRLALAKAVKAALWVTEARLNLAIPELLKMAQLWTGKSKTRGATWTAPKGVTDIEGLDDAEAPWASWAFNGQHWRIDAQWRPSALPDEIEGDVGSFKVLLDGQLVLDMTISSRDPELLWVDALTVGPWVSELLAFAVHELRTQRRDQVRDRRARTKSERTIFTGRSSAITSAFHPKQVKKILSYRHRLVVQAGG